MKKIINLFLVFAICLLSVTTAFAAGSKYVYDDGSMLPEDVESVLNQVARTFYKDYGIEVFIATNRGIDEKYAEHKFDRENSTDDGMMLAVNSKDGEAYIYTSGRMDGLLSDSDLNKLHKAYENEESPSAGMTEFLAKLSKILESKNVKKIPSERQKPRLVDDADLLTTSEEERLLDKLDEISERQQCDVAVVTVNSTNGKTPQAFADDYYDYNGYGMGEGDDGVMLVISMEERDWYVTTYGFGIKAMTDDALDEMADKFTSYLTKGNYYKAFSIYAECCDYYIRQAKNSRLSERQKPRLIDDADLLTTSEEERLLDKLDEISEKQLCDVAVVTVNSTDGKTLQDFADYYYYSNGYGMGERDNGVMLVFSMEECDWYVTTYGFVIQYITDDVLDEMKIKAKSHLSNANYYEAFSIYAERCDDYITQAKNGKPYDKTGGKSNRDNDEILVDIGSTTFISVVIALIVAFCVTAKLKAELKTVAPQRSASNYQRPNSLNITGSHETFLFKNVSKVKIQSSSSGGRSGGSRTHRSSSGRSHGGRGGKF